MKLLILSLLLVATPAASQGLRNKKKGLNAKALQELDEAGVFKYLGDGGFTPETTEGPDENGWVKHSFGDSLKGPVCIAGTEFSAFTRAGNPSKLVVFLSGGGACWNGFYKCNLPAELQSPLAPVNFVQGGIGDFEEKDNPFKDYSVVFLPYCDGSVWSGDNDVLPQDDPQAHQDFLLYHYLFYQNLPPEVVNILPPAYLDSPSGRYHRGLRNLSAGMDLAKSLFPNAKRLVIAGASAGGVGAQAFAPFLARKLFGNNIKLFVFNDSGPIVVNLDENNQDAEDDVVARKNDWMFDTFYPSSCTECSGDAQATATVDWRLKNDVDITEAFYDTDGDLVSRDYLRLLFDQPAYRNLIVDEHGKLNAKYPDRYKRFIVSGDTSHVATSSDLFYTQDANNVLLSDWTDAFVTPKKPFWNDIVEDPLPLDP